MSFSKKANKCFNPILTKTRLRAIHSNAIDPQLSEATAMRRSHILIIPSKQNTLRRPQFRHDVLSGITARITPKNLSHNASPYIFPSARRAAYPERTYDTVGRQYRTDSFAETIPPDYFTLKRRGWNDRRRDRISPTGVLLTCTLRLSVRSSKSLQKATHIITIMATWDVVVIVHLVRR
ncbi:uncharacterized protein LACBIDRAFT_321260 [Laccaria bicolor S238N-H82]|uniref:Predicted protein n=1 Tax=Laccaria bicolor (strain S238N-H82 / ATCC MYA-4686) TaxID=486041 RepID=B0CP97_LACBS|nr:uncharacterized protein LACBIDRAFT_321260 [Laccaria bicolor S238N-H82]EDR15441.1 predicted protein [Laccaria bicolor S238N-H82]|eukprot:XP_001873649.1 predicted protein [Laccaria bicolor S238N-H82]